MVINAVVPSLLQSSSRRRVEIPCQPALLKKILLMIRPDFFKRLLISASTVSDIYWHSTVELQFLGAST